MIVIIIFISVFSIYCFFFLLQTILLKKIKNLADPVQFMNERSKNHKYRLCMSFNAGSHTIINQSTNQSIKSNTGHRPSLTWKRRSIKDLIPLSCFIAFFFSYISYVEIKNE